MFKEILTKVDEARKYDRKEVVKQYELAFDEMFEAVYQIGQHDKTASGRIADLLDDIDKEFKNSGI